MSEGATRNVEDQSTELARFVSPRVLDRIEQIGIVVLWSWLALRVANSINPYAVLVMVSETTILLFTVFRRPTQAISMRTGDWYLAIVATFAPPMVMMVDQPLPGMAEIAVLLVALGSFIQLFAKLILRRSFGIAPANRGVKTSGPYRYVRHPMYTGYIFAQVGVLLALPSLFNLAVMAVSWTAQVLRLEREEALLSQDPSYREFQKEVPWRLFPGIY